MIVADTNLIAYLVLSGEHTAAAEKVLEVDAEWAVPLLWRSELRSVLALYLRRGSLSLDAALALYKQAARLVQGREYEVDPARILALVGESDCFAYDCEFVALAEILGVPLVTSDRRVLNAFPRRSMSPATFVRDA